MVHHCLVAGEDLVLACELSRPDAVVRWLRNGQEVHPGERVQIEARGVLRQLTINGAQPSDTGCYICDAASDCMVTNVEVSGGLAQNPRDPPEWWDHATDLDKGKGSLCDPADAEARVAVWQGRVGAPSPTLQKPLVRERRVRVVARHVPAASPSQGLFKFSLGWLPGAAPPASAAKG